MSLADEESRTRSNSAPATPPRVAERASRRTVTLAVGAASMAAKTPLETRKGKALDAGLRGMFKALARRPVPDRQRSVVDQLDEGEASAPASRKAKRG